MVNMPCKDHEKRKNASIEWKKRNPQKVQELNKKRYEQNRCELISYAIKRRKDDPNRLEIAKRHSKRARDNLYDSYVRRSLAQYMKIKGSEIPKQLVEAHRELIKLKRMINEKL